MPEPMTSCWSSAVPPSNFTIVDTAGIVQHHAVAVFHGALHFDITCVLFAFFFNLRHDFFVRYGKSGSGTSSFRYAPSVTSGFNCTSAVKTTPSAVLMVPISTEGLSTAVRLCSASAASYASPQTSSNASS